MKKSIFLPNGGLINCDEIPCLETSDFQDYIKNSVLQGCRIASLFAAPAESKTRLFGVLANEQKGLFAMFSTNVDVAFGSLTPDCPQAHLFEREIAEQWRVEPVGHPWLKPVRFENPRRGGEDLIPGQSQPKCGTADFYRIEGEEIHEVAVGPVHAGIIEPGHFRFQCHGEVVHHLEISLGYQHRGIESAILMKEGKRTLHYMETLAGDTTAGHTMAYCRAMEALAICRVPARAQVIRGIALELERMANHVGDLGALAGDIGFLPTMSYCGRIRGDVLNLTADLCGNRFGRGLIVPGGVAFDVSTETMVSLRKKLEKIMKDSKSAIELLFASPSVLARFEGTGRLSKEDCETLGLVGVAARACGLECDVRSQYPYGIYRFTHVPALTWHTGDVFARAYVRWLEIQTSAEFIFEQLRAMPDGPVNVACGNLLPNRATVSLVEGWRGEICHTAMTGQSGKLTAYKIVDPSFHNWQGLAFAMRGQQVSDFPLCNKSFNLSYCGFDL